MFREQIAFTAQPKIQSQSHIFRYDSSIFCLPHRPNFSDIFDLCLHWVSVLHGSKDREIFTKSSNFERKILQCKEVVQLTPVFAKNGHEPLYFIATS